MKKDRKLYPYIEDFGKAVYGEYAHLAFASFNEESFIKDATEKITILQAEAAEMRRVLEKVREKLKEINGHTIIAKDYLLKQGHRGSELAWGEIYFIQAKAQNLLPEIYRLVGKEKP